MNENQNNKPNFASKFKSASKAFWNIVQLYSFSREEQATLLGIKHNRERLKLMQDHHLIPEADDVLLRVGMLIAIHKNLRIIFPYNRDLVYKWMKIENPDFEGLSPIEYISAGELGQGLNRFAAVRRRLDQVRCNGY
jgi:hypothetical protein